MPLDGHAFLVAQGWEGRGSGLRAGAIARPVTVAQKKTLSGIGKDRDEAFPFWDHVFEAASIKIQVKLHNDSDDESESTGPSTPATELQRTSTGILSNCRPKIGTPAFSSSATPEPSGSSTPRLSIMAAAKQEAARRSLYSRFFRGPVIGFDDIIAEVEAEAQLTADEMNAVARALEAMQEVQEDKPAAEKRTKKRGKAKMAGESAEELVVDAKKQKKKKRKADSAVDSVKNGTAAIATTSAEEAANKSEKKRRKRDTEAEAANSRETPTETERLEEGVGKINREAEKADKKRRKEDKRARKAEKEARKETKRAGKEQKRLKAAGS